MSKEKSDKLFGGLVLSLMLGFSAFLLIVVYLDEHGYLGEPESETMYLILRATAVIIVFISLPTVYLIGNEKKLRKIMKQLEIKD